MSTQGRQAVKVAALIAGGAVVGAGLGVLFAPKAGVETRRQVKQYAKRAQVGATRFGQSVKAGMDQTIKYGKSIMAKKESAPPQAA
ncbi:MAG TPA: YtxH domain-containing protein [Nitrospiraceae bacterium]|nr:YtxH domain-containing protein [Nitrospiraceae bacterium]